MRPATRFGVPGERGRVAAARAAGVVLACALAAACQGAGAPAPRAASLAWRVVPAAGSDVLVEVRIGVRERIRDARLSLHARGASVTPAAYRLGNLAPPAAPPHSAGGPVADRALVMRSFRVRPSGGGRPVLTLELRWDGGMLRRPLAWPSGARDGSP